MGIDKLKNERERKAYDLGEGVWFRNSDEAGVSVTVTFYPTVQRWIADTEGKRKTTKEDLDSNYQLVLVCMNQKFRIRM